MTPERLQEIKDNAAMVRGGMLNDCLAEIAVLQERCRRSEERKKGPLVDAADLKADACGCNVVMKRYSNPFHRPYYKVSRCERHNLAEAHEKRIAELEAEVQAQISWSCTVEVESLKKDAELKRLTAANQRFVEWLNGAPHAIFCASRYPRWPARDRLPCDCWKKEADDAKTSRA